MRVCSGVGKEQEIIGNPRLLQLRRSVSRALGKNAEEDTERAHAALANSVPMQPTINTAQNELKKRSRTAGEKLFVGHRADQSRLT